MTDAPTTKVVSPPARGVLRAGSLVASAARAALLATALPLSSLAASAAPIELKLAFFPPERTEIYEAAIKPFVDAVNAEGKDLLTIKVYPNGALGKAVAEQPQMVLDGIADIGWVIPGQTPYRFPDNQLLEMPGLFRDTREGTLVYTRLVAAKALRGYERFVVIGAFTSDPTFIHSREPIGSLADLKGQRIRANNQIEAEALERLGAIPTVMPASRLADAIGRGALDGVALAPTALFDFRVAPMTKNHYLLGGGVAPLVLVMSRKTFDNLPQAGQALIRKYSGERAAAAWIASFGASEQRLLGKIKADPTRKVVEPSPADRETAQRVYQSLIDTWAAKSPRNGRLLKSIEADLATIRSPVR